MIRVSLAEVVLISLDSNSRLPIETIPVDGFKTRLSELVEITLPSKVNTSTFNWSILLLASVIIAEDAVRVPGVWSKNWVKYSPPTIAVLLDPPFGTPTNNLWPSLVEEPVPNAYASSPRARLPSAGLPSLSARFIRMTAI